MTAYFNSRSGRRGVCFDRQHNAWRATIYYDKKQHQLGFFKRIGDAVEAHRVAWEKKYLTKRGEFGKKNSNGNYKKHKH